MLRRSTSTSHLPVPTSSRAGSLVRSKSFSRNQLSVDPPHKPSVTPSYSRYPGSKSSLARSSLFSGTPGSSSKSPFQKVDKPLVNDKAWVSEKYAKVCNLLRQLPNFDVKLLKSFTKPLMTNTFLTIIEILMREIEPDVAKKLTLATFKDIIPEQLKLMHYPGTLSNSLFKTVNTTHSWPQVISIFSWLVEFIEGLNGPVDLGEQLLPGWEYHRDLYQDFNNNDGKTEEIHVNFRSSLAAALKVNPQEIEDEKAIYNKNLDYIRKLSNDYNVYQDEVQQLSGESNRKLLEIEAFETDCIEKERQYDEETAAIKVEISKLREYFSEVQASKQSLEEIVRTQPCSFEEKQKLCSRTEELKHTLALQLERHEKMKNIKDQFDYRLVTAKKKIESEVYRLNNELLDPILKRPDLKVLNFRVEKFFEPSFEDEISSHMETKAKLLKDLREEYHKTLLLGKQQDEVKSLDVALNSARATLEKTESEIFELKKGLEESAVKQLLKLQNAIKNSEDMEKMIEETAKSTRDNGKAFEKLSGLKKRQELLTRAFKTQSTKCVDFLSEVQTITHEKYKVIADMHNDLKTRLDSKLELVRDEQNEIFKVLKQFEPFLEQKKK